MTYAVLPRNKVANKATNIQFMRLAQDRIAAKKKQMKPVTIKDLPRSPVLCCVIKVSMKQNTTINKPVKITAEKIIINLSLGG